MKSLKAGRSWQIRNVDVGFDKIINYHRKIMKKIPSRLTQKLLMNFIFIFDEFITLF